MPVAWPSTISASDIDCVRGKGASLGELTRAWLPMPSGFVATVDSYRTFIEETGIAEALFDAVDVDVADSTALAKAEQRARKLIFETEWPETQRQDVLKAYDDISGEPVVAVRSSATTEDLPDASFAGQQETFLNVTCEELGDRIKRCWASLFTQRAIYYRQEQGFVHDAVDITVVVQQMVDAEKSGMMFTSHPSTGAPQLIIEAAWRLGEAIVSRSVTLDNYVFDRMADELDDVTVAGVAKRTPNYKAESARDRGYPLYVSGTDTHQFISANLDIVGRLRQLVKASDVIVDTTPVGVGARNSVLYQEIDTPAVYQGGEDADIGPVSFNARANCDEAKGADAVRVVSCNTTDLPRLLAPIDERYGIEKVRVTLVWRGDDPS